MSKKAKHVSLYLLRMLHGLTQAEMAAKCGVSCRGYQNIEWGERDGTMKFWTAVQREFDIPAEEMYSLMKVEEQVEK